MSEGVVARERELGTVAEFLAQVRDGPAALVLTGEPGIGKTTLWQEAVARAQASSMTVLVARPVEAEVQLAFAALSDLLEPVVDTVLTRLSEPQRHALAVALLREEPGPHGLDQRAVSAAVTGVLGALARDAPVVIAVDDLQWLDRPSARVLDFALRRVGRLPIGLLACERIPADQSVVPEVGLLQGQVTRLKLGPLSLAALHEVVQARLGRSLGRRTLIRIQQTAGGNPFFTLEIARALPEQIPPGPAALPIPSTVRALLEARIASLSRRARTALLAAAALRSPTVELVAAGMGSTGSEAQRALEHTAAAGIIGIEGSQLRFVHPLFAAVLYSSAPMLDRRRIHRRLAGSLGDVEERAWHLALGADGADADLARVVEAGAEHAAARGAPEAAVELMEQALRLTPLHQVAELRSRSVRAAEYRFHAGELRRAHELLEAVLERAAEGPVRADALRVQAEIHYYEQGFQESVRLFEEALQHVGEDAALASRIELHLTFAANAAGAWALAEPHARRALVLAQQLGDDQRLAEALAVSAMLSYLLGRGLDAAKLDQALELEDEHRQAPGMMRPTLIAGSLFLYQGHVQRACDLLGGLRQRLLERGEESELPYVCSHLAWAETWRGNLAAAERYAGEALEVSLRAGMASMRCYALAFASLPAAYRGDGATTRDRAREAIALAGSTGFTIAPIWARWGLGILALSLGDAGAADAALAPLTTLVERDGIQEPVRVMFLGEAIEALIALRELDRAGRLIDELEVAAKRLERGWALLQARRCRALHLAVLGDLDQAARVAHEALAAGEHLEVRLELARTLLVAGQIERRRRRKRASGDLLQRALVIFEEAPAALWARRTRLELVRTAGRPAGDELTVSEERVARLVGSGLTNREVAAQLFVSPKTVEANLARVYRKLGIRSRAELGTRIALGQDGAGM